MPITARLSKKFYDRLGDDIVGELIELLNQVDEASRTELREINESNFARFDAKLEQRAAELRTEIVACKESTLRWMLAIWFTQMLTFAGMWLGRS